MYSTFPKDFLKILFFATLVSMIFTLVGWQAGTLYFDLHAETTPPPTPLYIFPVPITKSAQITPHPAVLNKKRITEQKPTKLTKKTFPKSIPQSTTPSAIKTKTPLLSKKKTPLPALKRKKRRLEKKEGFRTVLQKKAKKRDMKTVLLTYPENKKEHHPIEYSIQTGIFRFRSNAERNFNYCLQRGYNPVMVILDYKHKMKIYSVRFGHYQSEKTARLICKNFKIIEKKDAYPTTLRSKKYLVAVARKFAK